MEVYAGGQNIMKLHINRNINLWMWLNLLRNTFKKGGWNDCN